MRLPAPLSSACLVFLLGAVVVLLVYQLRLGWHQLSATGDDYEGLQAFRVSPPQQQQQQALPHVLQDTLVVYLYNEDDAVFKSNFQHFLVAGVLPNTRAQYVVVVQERSLRTAVSLPTVPEATYIYYAGTCYEWGIVGWLLLESGRIDWKQYSYFVMVSSAVRGPFMPTYLQGKVHWTEPLISRLTERVKLVGPTISCSGALSDPSRINSTWRSNPHIPFSAVATDRVGLQALIDEGQVMGCYSNVWAAKYHSELGAAAAIFKAGYSIDSLLIRYQNVEWSHPSAWECNRRWDPAGIGDFSYDGIALDPMEAVFVRVNTALLNQRVPMAVKAVKYSHWLADVAAAAAGQPHNLTGRVQDNLYQADKGRFKLPRILTCMVRGIKCFDVDFFLAHNHDIFPRAPRTRTTLQIAWKFFVYLGQFEDRPFRFTCDMNYSSVAVPAF